MAKIIVYKGGKGSGNFGHEGRPGKVGGSNTSDNDAANISANFSNADKKHIVNYLKRVQKTKSAFSGNSFMSTREMAAVKNFIAYKIGADAKKIKLTDFTIAADKKSVMQSYMIWEQGKGYVKNSITLTDDQFR